VASAREDQVIQAFFVEPFFRVWERGMVGPQRGRRKMPNFGPMGCGECDILLDDFIGAGN
jgi:hypothetical protein